MKQFSHYLNPKFLRVHMTMIIIMSFSMSYGQNSNKNWKEELALSIDQYIECKKASDEANTCLNFLGESLTKVYNVNDFYSKTSKKYLQSHEITKFLSEGDQWTSLGHAYDPKVLAKAQSTANSNKAVVAVYINSSTGLGEHVALIIPGELKHSGSWGLKVPNTTSFLSIKPENSFTNQALSYAFRRDMMKDVIIYARNN